jgi:hypothetical protein
VDGQSSVGLHVDDGVADGLCVDGLHPGVHGDEHGVEGDVLDEPWDAAAVMEDLGDGFRFEDVLSFAPGGFEVLLDEGSDSTRT